MPHVAIEHGHTMYASQRAEPEAYGENQSSLA